MEILLKKEDILKLSWSPGCYFDGNNYVLGAIGRRGPGVTEEDLKIPWICKGVPSSLEFNIRFNNIGDIDLYNKIKDIIVDIKNTDKIDVKTTDPPLRKNKINIKNEYKDQIDKITEDNKVLNNKYLSIIKQLNDLGCDCYNLGEPIYQKIPNDWYEWEEYYDATGAGISVCCHSKTKFFSFLNENGILDKYFPEWYKLGKF